MTTTQRLEQAMWDAFGETISGPADAGPLSPVQQPARILAVRDNSATADYVDALGNRQTIAITRHDDGSWWITGRTLEATSGMRFSHETLSQLARRCRYLSKVAAPLHAQIRTNVYASAEDLRAALGDALEEAHPYSEDVMALIESPPVAKVRPSPGTGAVGSPGDEHG